MAYTKNHENFNKLSHGEQEMLIRKVGRLYNADIDVENIVSGLNQDPGLICEVIDVIEERHNNSH